MDVLTMKELLETGVHFGHRTRKWNPKMSRYIFTERKGIHIIDLEQTVALFKKAYYYVRDNAAEGKEILFIGTKKQVQTTILEEAQRCGAHYVNRRWLGGTLTNFATIKHSIDRMKELERMIEDGTIEHVPNKEASKLRRELAKLVRNLDGLRNMQRVPDLMYVIDPDVEANPVHEANLLGIPVIAIVDTNCDPDPIDFPIPGNDDAIKATKLITSRIADAVIEGHEGRQDAPRQAAPAAVATAPELESKSAEEDKAAAVAVVDETIDLEAEPETEPAVEVETESETEPAAKTETEAEAEPEAEPVPVATPEPDEEADGAVEAETESEGKKDE
ncbi:30S ribosomal protein S2 [Candidatus Bipolaricaulota bacterium]|nr:30S ribosomal protein S2 [Candidatus Bipolaricaulota bacterium]